MKEWMSKHKNGLIFGIVGFLIVTILLFVFHIPKKYHNSEFSYYLEALYYISCPLVLIVSIVALRQISITSDIAKNNSKRDSIRLTAEQCECFYISIIPLVDKLDDETKKLGITTYGTADIKKTKTGLSVNVTLDPKVKKFVKELAPYFTKALNSIDAFSTYMVSGVVDEKLAYYSVGQTYCDMIKKLYPVIFLVSDNKHYKNTIKLYTIWDERTKSSEIEKKMSDLKSELNLQANYSINTIGY